MMPRPATSNSTTLGAPPWLDRATGKLSNASKKETMLKQGSSPREDFHERRRRKLRTSPRRK